MKEKSLPTKFETRPPLAAPSPEVAPTTADALLRAAAQVKQAMFLSAIQGKDAGVQIALAKRYLGLSDKAPPPPPALPTYRMTFEERKRSLEKLVNKYPHLLDADK